MNARDLVFFFGERWKEKYGSSYPANWARDGHIFKDLLKDYSFVELSQHIRVYLSSEFQDNFVAQNGHTVPLFRVSLPKLVSLGLTKEKSKPDLSNQDDFRRLEEARSKLK